MENAKLSLGYAKFDNVPQGKSEFSTNIYIYIYIYIYNIFHAMQQNEKIALGKTKLIFRCKSRPHGFLQK